MLLFVARCKLRDKHAHTTHLLCDSLSDTPPSFQLFFLFSNVGRGNAHTAAAVLTEIPSEGEEENHNKQVSLSLQNMVNKTKVKDMIVFNV